MSKILRTLGLVLALSSVAVPVAVPVATAQVAPSHYTPRISLDAARRTAMARIDGRIRHEELASDSRRWVYVFEIIAGPSGIEIVNVDADTGQIVGVAHGVR